jgi:hypothetical protein
MLCRTCIRGSTSQIGESLTCPLVCYRGEGKRGLKTDTFDQSDVAKAGPQAEGRGPAFLLST